jgi:hypothetical protein
MPHAPRRTISGSDWEKSITVVGSVPQSASAGGCRVEVVCQLLESVGGGLYPVYPHHPAGPAVHISGPAAGKARVRSRARGRCIRGVREVDGRRT